MKKSLETTLKRNIAKLRKQKGFNAKSYERGFRCRELQRSKHHGNT